MAEQLNPFAPFIDEFRRIIREEVAAGYGVCREIPPFDGKTKRGEAQDGNLKTHIGLLSDRFSGPPGHKAPRKLSDAKGSEGEA